MITELDVADLVKWADTGVITREEFHRRMSENLYNLVVMNYPPNPASRAATGFIPIEFFTEFELAYRHMMRQYKLRAIYRGPRVSNNSIGRPSMTRRCDATHVVLYPN